MQALESGRKFASFLLILEGCMPLKNRYAQKK